MKKILSVLLVLVLCTSVVSVSEALYEDQKEYAELIRSLFNNATIKNKITNVLVDSSISEDEYSYVGLGGKQYTDKTRYFYISVWPSTGDPSTKPERVMVKFSNFRQGFSIECCNGLNAISNTAIRELLELVILTVTSESSNSAKWYAEQIIDSYDGKPEV